MMTKLHHIQSGNQSFNLQQTRMAYTVFVSAGVVVPDHAMDDIRDGQEHCECDVSIAHTQIHALPELPYSMTPLHSGIITGERFVTVLETSMFCCKDALPAPRAGETIHTVTNPKVGVKQRHAWHGMTVSESQHALEHTCCTHRTRAA
jgi:hypothetical protein